MRFALPEPFEPMATEEATRELARRYLTRYGPATREDLAKWFGSPTPAPPGRWIKALGDEVVETEFGWALGDDVAAIEARRARPGSSACCRPSTSTSSPPRATRGRPRARAHLPPGRLVLAGAARRRRDGGRLAPRGRRGHDRAVREGRRPRCARRPRPRPPGCRVRRPVAGRANLRSTPPLVTISASYGAGGSQIGPALAQRLGVEFLDRAIPTRVADRLQVPIDDALAHDESLGDAIGRFVSSFALLPELAGAMVQAGVLGGRGLPARDRAADPRARGRRRRDPRPRGAVILRDEPDALHVRLDGPPERRVANAMELEGLDRGRRRAAAQERRPRPRGLRAPLLRLRRARSGALSPRDRLDRARRRRPWSRSSPPPPR